MPDWDLWRADKIWCAVRSGSCRFVEVVAQDPKFGEMEKLALQRLDIRVVEDPEAQALVDKHTFTFTPFWEHESEIFAQPRNLRPMLHFGADLTARMAEENAILGVTGYVSTDR